MKKKVPLIVITSKQLVEIYPEKKYKFADEIEKVFEIEKIKSQFTSNGKLRIEISFFAKRPGWRETLEYIIYLDDKIVNDVIFLSKFMIISEINTRIFSHRHILNLTRRK